MTCGNGYAYQTRAVTVPPQGAGAACPVLYQQKGCQVVLCGVPPGGCFYGNTVYVGPNTYVTNTSTVQECQSYCQAVIVDQNQTCVGFTFGEENNQCYLKMAVTQAVSNGSTINYVSGPAECPQTGNSSSVYPPGEGGVSAGVIVGASVGGLLALILIGGGVYAFTHRSTEEPDEEYDYNATDGDHVYVGTRDYAEDKQDAGSAGGSEGDAEEEPEEL